MAYFVHDHSENYKKTQNIYFSTMRQLDTVGYQKSSPVLMTGARFLVEKLLTDRNRKHVIVKPINSAQNVKLQKNIS